jgi:hypothetical protein
MVLHACSLSPYPQIYNLAGKEQPSNLFTEFDNDNMIALANYINDKNLSSFVASDILSNKLARFPFQTLWAKSSTTKSVLLRQSLLTHIKLA